MREIKFRGLNGTKTKWIYAMLDNITKLFQHNGVWKETVGQFTGLHDKNGVEVYDGDVVKSDLDKIGEVKYSEDHMSFVILEKSEMKYYYMTSADERCIEVIGNIHERSEDNDK